MSKLDRRLKRALSNLIWDIVKLPFKLVYLPFRWILSDKRLSKDGYILKTSSSGKNQFEHRFVAEDILGRRLAPWEVVHHINGKRDDNRPSNLCVMPRIDHDRYHKWYDWVRAKGRFPRRETQLKKLREIFNGIVLSDSESKRKRTA